MAQHMEMCRQMMGQPGMMGGGMMGRPMMMGGDPKQQAEMLGRLGARCKRDDASMLYDTARIVRAAVGLKEDGSPGFRVWNGDGKVPWRAP